MNEGYKYQVKHSPIPLPADAGDGPFMAASVKEGTQQAPLASVQVFNHPTEDSVLKRIVYGKYADTSAFIRVSDVLGPKRYKRIVRYLTIYPRKDLRDDMLCIAFAGRKSDIHSHLVTEMVGGPTNVAMKTVANAVSLLQPIISNGSPLAADGFFKIVMAPIQADYVRDFCEQEDFMSGKYTAGYYPTDFVRNARQLTDKNPRWPITFHFNNGSQKYIMFYGDVGRNILISLDIINPDPISSTLLEFNIYALQMRRGGPEVEAIGLRYLQADTLSGNTP